MKYRVLIDYGSYEGMRWAWASEGPKETHIHEFDTVDEAVKHALGNSGGCPFHIVTVIDWKATP